MLFGKPAQTDEVELSELEAYLNGCFDLKLKRLMAKAPETEKDLEREFSFFAQSVKKFSESDSSPDMEYLYGIKENQLRSQKPSYASSLLHIVSARPAYHGANIYFKSESMLKSYNEFILKVLSDNTKFRLVMMGYAGELKDTKAHFNAMEKLCKDLALELNSSSSQFAEYREIDGKIKSLLGHISQIDSLKSMLAGAPEQSMGRNELESGLDENVKEKERQLEAARKAHSSARAHLAGLLLPLERVARKHDHSSASKRKLTDYIKEPEVMIRTEDDLKALNSQISLVVEEVRSGSMDVKNPEALIAQLNGIKEMDLLLLAHSVNHHDTELKRLEGEARALRARLHEVERTEDEKRKITRQKGEMEEEIKKNTHSAQSIKKDIEWLLHTHYKKQVLIKIEPL